MSVAVGGGAASARPSAFCHEGSSMPRFASFSFESAANFGRKTVLARPSAETGTTLEGLPIWRVSSTASSCHVVNPAFTQWCTPDLIHLLRFVERSLI